MAILLKTMSVLVSSIQIMQVRVQNKGKSVWKSRYDGDVSVGAKKDWLAYLRPDTTIIFHNIHNSAAVPVDPSSTIGIGLPDWLGLTTYDDAYMRWKKIAISVPSTKQCG